MNDTDYPICSIYICTSENYREMWKGWKDAGWPIYSSWIEDKETTAERRIYEARVSKALIFWYPAGEKSPDEFSYEIGAALAAGRAVIFAEGAASHPLAIHHGVVAFPDIEVAMTYANEIVTQAQEERRTWFNTYCGYQFRCDTRKSDPSEADVIAVWSTPEMIQKAIILAWPSGEELAAKICEHIDAAMVESYHRGRKDATTENKEKDPDT